MKDLKPEQMDQLQEEIARYIKNDLNYHGDEICPHFIFRFMRARKMHPANTKKMISEYVKFQNNLAKDSHINMKVDPNRFKEIRDFIQYEGICETDIHGQPVVYAIFSKMDLEKIVKTYEKDEIIAFMISKFERITRILFPILSAKYNKKIDRMTTIIDMKGVSPFFFVKGKPAELVKQYFFILQNYYPELLNKCYIINCSNFFSVVWAFIKPFLDPATLARIEVIQEKFMPILTKTINIENIPQLIGGTNEREIRHCPGPWQPIFEKSILLRTWRLTEVLEHMNAHGEPIPEELKVLKPCLPIDIKKELIEEEVEQSPETIKNLEMKLENMKMIPNLTQSEWNIITHLEMSESKETNGVSFPQESLDLRKIKK